MNIQGKEVSDRGYWFVSGGWTGVPFTAMRSTARILACRRFFLGGKGKDP